MQVSAVGQQTSAAQAAQYTAGVSSTAFQSALSDALLLSGAAGVSGGAQSLLAQGVQSLGADGSADVSTFAGLLGASGGLLPAVLILAQLMSAGDSSSNSLMSWLSSIISGLQGKDEPLRKQVMNSDNETWILDQINRGVFGRTTDGSVPYEAWKKTDPALTSTEGMRDANTYSRVIDQFDVENNGRYERNKAGRNDTYCNIFAWDVTQAMGAEIPHYTDAETGEPRVYPDTKGALAMTANRMYDWLARHGENYGWRRVTAEEAQAYANAGCPAVTVWKNPGGHGHIQVVRPAEDGGYDVQKGAAVAQAGRLNFSYGNVTDIFSGSALNDVAYYAHA